MIKWIDERFVPSHRFNQPLCGGKERVLPEAVSRFPVGVNMRIRVVIG
jgi:hypothetical protein